MLQYSAPPICLHLLLQHSKVVQYTHREEFSFSGEHVFLTNLPRALHAILYLPSTYFALRLSIFASFEFNLPIVF